MVEEPDFQKALGSLACPTSGAKLIRTKENILFCQESCIGYPFLGEIPDFREESAIPFKKLAQQKREGFTFAKILFTPKKSEKQIFELEIGHCLLVGRAVYLEPNTDITFVGIPQENRVVLNQQTRLLIDKFLGQKSFQKQDFGLEGLPLHSNQYLGSFERTPDLLLDDKSVSRAHAIFYHDQDGLWLLDLVSKNGSFVNGREVERVKLKHDDVIYLGRAQFRIFLR